MSRKSDNIGMIAEKLAALGLDDKEIRFYLAALELGSASVTEVASRAKVTRTNGYDILARLEERGLLSQTSGNGVRNVVAEDPGVLLNKWDETRNVLQDLVPELRSLFNAAPHKPKVRFYEGADGIEKVLWGTLDCRDKRLVAILSMNELLEVPSGPGMQRYIDERVRRGIALRVLRSRSRETASIWQSSIAELRDLRYAPGTIDLGMTMYIHDDTVSYLSSKKENYGLVIESAELAALHRALFEGLWLSSQPADLAG